MNRYRAVLVFSLLLVWSTTAAADDFVIDQVSDTSLECDWPAVASSPDGLTIFAWVGEDTSMWDLKLVYTQLVPTYPEPGTPLPDPVVLGPGVSPAVCWSREGFTLAFASNGFVLLFQSDLAGNFDPEEFDVLTPYPDAFGIHRLDLWGNAGEGAGPHVFLSVGGTLYLPEIDHKVLYAGRTELGWSVFELVAEDLQFGPLPRITYDIGPYGPLPCIFYMNEMEQTPALVQTTRSLEGIWQGPNPVPGAGGITPGPVGSEFDVHTWDFETYGVLGMGMQPTCPCNVIFFIGHDLEGGWHDPVHLTVNYGLEYDWPMSPNVAGDDQDRVHAFWFQEASTFMMEPHLRTLEYWVAEGGVWQDESDFLADHEGGPLGSRVAMAVTDAGQPVFAWTRKDTVENVPQPQAIWMARPAGPSDVPGDQTPGIQVAIEAFPNPFNPRTTLFYDLPVPASVELGIYDLAGRLVRSFPRQVHSAGRHSVVWDGRDDAGRELTSGIYLARVWAGPLSRSAKLVLVR